MSVSLSMTQSMPARCLGWVAITALLLATTGCTRNLAGENLEKSISAGLASQLGLEMESVTCPKSRPIAAGDVFSCTATPRGGGRLTITVTQKDGAGNVDWEVGTTQGLLDLAKVEGSIRAGLREQAGVDVTASCGGRWRPAKTGDTFECQAVVGGEQAVAIVVSVEDDDGGIRWSTR